MHIPVKLSKYIAKHFFSNFLVVLCILFLLLFIFDLIELIKRTYSKDIAFKMVLELALLKLPFLLDKVLPFIFIIATMLAFTKLNRNSEITVMRSQGNSLLNIIVPAVFVTILIALFNVTILNPLSAIMLNRHEKIENKYLKDGSNFFAVHSSGLWLKENNHEYGRVIINAANMRQDNLELSNISFFILDNEQNFVKRFDAKTGTLEKGFWSLKDVVEVNPEKMSVQHTYFTIPTKIVKEQLLDSYSAPEAVSFWELPSFIVNLENAGFSASRHKLHFYNLLLSPLFFIAILLIIFPFTLSQVRQGKILLLSMSGILVGFSIFFFSDLIFALGAGGKLPIFLASVAPIAITGAVGMLLMQRLERR